MLASEEFQGLYTMKPRMLSMRKQLKVFQSVVGFLFILVVKTLALPNNTARRQPVDYVASERIALNVSTGIIWTIDAKPQTVFKSARLGVIPSVGSPKKVLTNKPTIGCRLTPRMERHELFYHQCQELSRLYF